MGTATGPVKLRAKFVPEDIGIRWYDGNTQVNVSDTSKTCTYDTSINLPTTPTRTGYTFNGWKVTPQYDFSTLAINTKGIMGYGKGARCMYGTSLNGENFWIGACNGDNKTLCSDLNIYEWKAVFSWGTIYGMSKCSNVIGTDGISGNPGEVTGQYCWCKVTGYVPNNDNIKYSPILTSNYIYNSNPGTSCSNVCAGRCGIYVAGYTDYGTNFFH